MLTIVKGLPWSVDFSVFDDAEQTIISDFTGKTLVCEIRGRIATAQEYPLIKEVTVNMKVFGFTLSLSAANTDDIPWDNYLIDVVTTDGEIILPREVIKVVGHVTLP